jgi:hypothetical protein
MGGNYSVNTHATSSAVSWGAIVAGAAGAASLSLILLILGVGLGLSTVSPWTRDGVSAATFGMSSILWLTLTQLLASAMGGYIAGRLRTKWTEVHRDEVFFRDTAHGFLSWAVASLVTAGLLTSVIGSILSGGVQAGASVVSGVASAAGSAVGAETVATRISQSKQDGLLGYFVDSLFRAAPASGASTALKGSTGPAERGSRPDMGEIGRIFMSVSGSQPLPVDDVRYVAQIVAQRTGLSQQDAEKRVTDVYAKAQAQVLDAQTAARDATDKARKASAYGALWLFLSLLIGAFFASLAATFGGRRRDF